MGDSRFHHKFQPPVTQRFPHGELPLDPTTVKKILKFEKTLQFECKLLLGSQFQISQ